MFFPAAIGFFLDIRQANGALSGMMSDRVGYQADFTFSGYLLHDLRLSNSRRSHKKNGALSHGRYFILPMAVF